MSEPVNRRIGPIVAAILVGVMAIAAAFYFRPYQPRGEAGLVVSDAQVEVDRSRPGLVFRPLALTAKAGLAFYPGARVPPEAYAYLGKALARAGYLTVILALPLNFAIFSPSMAQRAIDAYPDVKVWAVGGHSLGGAMAASFCGRKPDKVSGLLLLAAYPGGGTDLSASGLRVLSISASNDGLATPAKLQAARHLMPASARFVELAGGNHAQFGDYGIQSGDGTATLSPQLEHGAVVEESLAFMGEILADVR